MGQSTLSIGPPTTLWEIRPMNPDDLQALLMAHLRAETAHDMAATLATVHPQCRFVDHGAGQVFDGRDGAARHYRQWWDAFDLRPVVGGAGAASWTHDGRFVAEGEFSGRHVGALADLAPTGRALRFRFCVLVGFRDGLLHSETFYYDLAGLAAQLGVDAGRLRAAFVAAQPQPAGEAA